MNRLKSLLLASAALAAGLVAGCANAVSVAEKPLRVAVYVDNGARNIGAFRWIEIATLAENVEAYPVDGAAVRSGALDNMDVLVMPGGKASIEALSLGEKGREKVKSFIRNGGGYIGSCAGCYLVMHQGKGYSKNYLGLLPYKDSVSGGRADINIKFNENATKVAGIKKGVTKVRYAGGPVPKHTGKEVEGTHVEVVATYAGDINTTDKMREPFTGKPAAFAATCGKGKIFVFTVHPESDVKDAYLVRGAFKFVSGRKLKWEYPQRKRGQLAVGFACDDSFGVETARFIQKLLKEGEYDIVPVNDAGISDGALRHLDAVLAPANAGSIKATAGLYGKNIKNTKEFLGRGGRIFAWGNAAERAKIHRLDIDRSASAEEALADLRKFALTPVPTPKTLPKLLKKPRKVAVFADDGCSMGTIPVALELAPEFDVGIVSGKEVAEGALEKYEMLYMPGGYSTVAFRTLGPKGRAKLVEFIRNGGKYYGVCGGAFLASRTMMNPKGTGLSAGNTQFLGLVPFKEDLPRPYRGKAETKIRLTKEGKKVFPNSEEVRKVWYAGGPAFLDAEPVEDTDITVFAHHEGSIINVSSEKKSKNMHGKVAMAGGRVGKGKVFVQCPHPESREYSFDMVRDILQYLTGARPSHVNKDRVRGAKSVYVKMGFRKGMNEAVKFVLKKLLRDRRFDCRIANVLDPNELAHSDAVVMCLFGKEDWTSHLKRFIERGGKLILVADSE
jgi:glutamine amidotransferase-like uncharacterized protein